MNATGLMHNRDVMAEARAALAGKWGQAAVVAVIYTVVAIALEFIPYLGGIVQILVVPPLVVGWALYALHLVWRQPSEISDLFDGFKRYGTSLLAYILSVIYILLWTLLLIIPGILAAFAYTMTFFIIADQPDIGANAAIGLSRKLMYGKRWKYFCLQLRFLGWVLLAMIFTLGIGMFWVWPYMMTAQAAFYEDLKRSAAAEAVPPVPPAAPPAPAV